MQPRDGSADAAMWLVRGQSDRGAAARGGVRFSANVAAFAYLHVHSRGRRPCRRKMHVSFPAGDTPARRLHVHSSAGIVHTIFCTCIFLSDAPDDRLLHVHFRAGAAAGRRVHAHCRAGAAHAPAPARASSRGTAHAPASARADLRRQPCRPKSARPFFRGRHIGQGLHVWHDPGWHACGDCTPDMPPGGRCRQRVHAAAGAGRRCRRQP